MTLYSMFMTLMRYVLMIFSSASTLLADSLPKIPMTHCVSTRLCLKCLKADASESFTLPSQIKADHQNQAGHLRQAQSATKTMPMLVTNYVPATMILHPVLLAEAMLGGWCCVAQSPSGRNLSPPYPGSTCFRGNMPQDVHPGF